ncbi:MAG TPA: hypothetical protein VIO16_01895 [Dehalococcoidia bacterium]
MNFDGRRLTRAIRAQEAEDLATAHLERDAVHGRHRAVPLDEVGHGDDGRRRGVRQGMIGGSPAGRSGEV